MAEASNTLSLTACSLDGNTNTGGYVEEDDDNGDSYYYNDGYGFGGALDGQTLSLANCALVSNYSLWHGRRNRGRLPDPHQLHRHQQLRHIARRRRLQHLHPAQRHPLRQHRQHFRRVHRQHRKPACRHEQHAQHLVQRHSHRHVRRRGLCRHRRYRRRPDVRAKRRRERLSLRRPAPAILIARAWQRQCHRRAENHPRRPNPPDPAQHGRL